MAKTKFFLDTRTASKDGTSVLKVRISHHAEVAFVPLEVKLRPDQWDVSAGKVIAHPSKNLLNAYIQKVKLDIDTKIIELLQSELLNKLSASDIKRIATGESAKGNSNSFVCRYQKFMEQKSGRTKEIYNETFKRMHEFCPDLESLSFEDINKDWLISFDKHLSLRSPSKNARNIHLRNIRAAFNDAIDNEITHFYPFRKFKLKNTQTVKRSLTVEQLREFFAFPLEEYQRQYMDMFKLMFFLCGINVIDLCNLDGINNGRIEYHRAKTGRLYSIKVEPEAMEIIERYRGKRQLLNMLDRYSNYKDYAQHLNRALQSVGDMHIEGQAGKKIRTPLFPNISTYWARHTWATVAAYLDIPKETIAAALGHAQNSVTDIYIRFDERKVDIANRKVMDYVLYGE